VAIRERPSAEGDEQKRISDKGIDCFVVAIEVLPERDRIGSVSE
jgi:hypothetical protein